jgi:uncharacterized protein YcaQ
LTPTLARRIAITRQKLAHPQPEATPNGMMDVFRNLSYIQIDPIRAVERTQFLVLWSRLGNYDRAHLDTLLWEDRTLFEYWAHAAAIVLTENYPIHHLQMRRFAQGTTKREQRVRAWLDTPINLFDSTSRIDCVTKRRYRHVNLKIYPQRPGHRAAGPMIEM